MRADLITKQIAELTTKRNDLWDLAQTTVSETAKTDRLRQVEHINTQVRRLYGELAKAETARLGL